MSRYIDADVFDKLLESRELWLLNEAHDYCMAGTIRGVRDLLEVQPTADVAPVVHARWVPGPLYLNILCQEYKCSICGRTLLLGNSKSLDEYPYCHCGAKMDKEETNG